MALGEATVDRSQEVERPPPLAPLGPEPGERGRCLQLLRQCLLLARDAERLLQRGLGSCGVAAADERLAP